MIWRVYHIYHSLYEWTTSEELEENTLQEAQELYLRFLVLEARRLGVRVSEGNR